MVIWHQLISLLPFDWAQFAFMHNALLAVLIVTPLFALLGCLVINNQMAFFSDAIGHSALTGIAIGTLAGIADPVWAMMGFAVVLALLISAFRRFSAAPPDAVISVVMAFAVALGVVLLSRGGGFARYSRFLVGDILTITPLEIARLGVLLGTVLLIWFFFFNRLFLVSLNRSLSQSRGMRVWLIDSFFSVLVALVVTVTIPWIGLLVINSLLILPAAAARNLSGAIWRYTLGAIIISLLSGMLGLVASYYWSTATGATIVLFALGFFLLSLLFRK